VGLKSQIKSKKGYCTLKLTGLTHPTNQVMGRGVFAVDKREWQDARKIASHMFSGNSLKVKMEEVFNLHADNFVSLLDDVAGKKDNVIDMQEAFQSVVFDGFCEIAFGVYVCVTCSFRWLQLNVLLAGCLVLRVYLYVFESALSLVWFRKEFYGSYWSYDSMFLGPLIHKL
jgi:hypothetical protein